MTATDKPIGVLGGGAFGTTLAHLTGSNDQQALLWMRDEERAAHLDPKQRGQAEAGRVR